MKQKLQVPSTVAMLALLISVSACTGGGDGGRAVDSADSGSAPQSVLPMPASVQAASGEMQAQGTVLEANGSSSGGAELCFAVADSYPPQCGGIAIRGWSWKKVGQYTERAEGVRWGTFALTGTFDGEVLTLTQDAIPLALYDPVAEAPAEDPLAIRCPEPTGGWQPVDPATTTTRALATVLRGAAQLDGYAAAWIGRPAGSQIDPMAIDQAGGEDPRSVVVNVVVTGDPAEAESVLRETWGGALCVTRSDRDAGDLERIQSELGSLPGLISAAALIDTVTVEVTYDDGSIQRWADQQYGEGVVRVDSALRPVSR